MPWYSFRQPGLCGLRGTVLILCIISWSIVFLIWTPPTTSFTPTLLAAPPDKHDPAPNSTRDPTPLAQHKHGNRPKRWVKTPTPVDFERKPVHPYATNMLWRYANSTAKAQGHENCFVCSLMLFNCLAIIRAHCSHARDYANVHKMVVGTVGPIPFDPTTYFNSSNIGRILDQGFANIV